MNFSGDAEHYFKGAFVVLWVRARLDKAENEAKNTNWDKDYEHLYVRDDQLWIVGYLCVWH